MVASLSCSRMFFKKKGLCGYIKVYTSKTVVDESQILKKGMDGLYFTYLWFGLCSTRKVMLHYEYAKTNDSA